MKRVTNLSISALMLFLTTLSLSCASLGMPSVPELANRTLRISPDIAGFEYQYEVCAKRFLGICTRKAMKKETYDLNDPEIRKNLIAMGFVVRVRDKP